MEMIKLQSNAISGYQPQPTLPFDIHGTVLSKEGKQIAVGAEIEGKKVEFDLRLNEEIVQEIGEEVYIEKEKVVSHSVRKEAFGLEGAGEEGGGARDVRRILEELGLSHTVDNVKRIEWMMTSGLELTQDTIHSFVMSEKYLEELQQELSVELITKMTLRGMDIEHMSLQELSQSVSKLKNETQKKSLAEWLGFERDLNYEEAEQIAKQLYGRKMGKDVYDAIIHLHHFNGELSKKNVDRVVELLSKIKSLKELSIQTFVSTMDTGCTIHSLYRIQHSLSNAAMIKNEHSESFDRYVVGSDDGRSGIERLIHLAGVEESSLSLSIFHELTIQGVRANKDNYEKVLKMKETVEEVLSRLDTKTIALLETGGVDVGNTAMDELLPLLTELPTEEEVPAISQNQANVNENENEFEISSKKIGIRDLISMIRSGFDMTLNELKDKLDDISITEVKEPVAVRTISVMKSMQIIGERLPTEVISRAHLKNEVFSLKTLEEATIEHSKNPEVIIRPIPESSEMLIRQEYNRIRSSLTLSIISRSIRENFDLQHSSLSEVDAFLQQGRQIYEKASRIRLRLKNAIGQSKILIPTILKNSLEMNLKEIMNLSHYLNETEQFGASFETIKTIDPGSDKEMIAQLKKTISDKLHAGEPFASEYRELLQAQANFSGGHSDGEESKEKSSPFQLSTVKKLSRGTVVLKIPVELEGKENHLNVLIPRSKQGLSKKDMSFFLSLQTDRLGTVNMGLEVSGKNVHIKFDEKNEPLENRIPKLREILSQRGYQLKVENLK